MVSFPEYLRTPLLPYKPNLGNGDVVAELDDMKDFFKVKAHIEEKIDGANSGILLYEDNPIIRNRTNILKKGYVKDTPAKIQFRSIFNYFYDNKDKFEEINNYFQTPMAVYGEWCVANHGTTYDKLPSYFIAYDLYDTEKHKFIEPILTRKILTKFGFSMPKLLYSGIIENYEFLDQYMNLLAEFSSTDKLEGIYIKTIKCGEIDQRFKLIRPDFIQGSNWNKDKIIKQKLAK